MRAGSLRKEVGSKVGDCWGGGKVDECEMRIPGDSGRARAAVFTGAFPFGMKNEGFGG